MFWYALAEALVAGKALQGATARLEFISYRRYRATDSVYGCSAPFECSAVTERLRIRRYRERVGGRRDVSSRNVTLGRLGPHTASELQQASLQQKKLNSSRIRWFR